MKEFFRKAVKQIAPDSSSRDKYPDHFYTVNEQRAAITFVAERIRKQFPDHTTQQLIDLSRAFDGVRDEIKDYLPELVATDVHLPLEIHKEDVFNIWWSQAYLYQIWNLLDKHVGRVNENEIRVMQNNQNEMIGFVSYQIIGENEVCHIVTTDYASEREDNPTTKIYGIAKCLYPNKGVFVPVRTNPNKDVYKPFVVQDIYLPYAIQPTLSLTSLDKLPEIHEQEISFKKLTDKHPLTHVTCSQQDIDQMIDVIAESHTLPKSKKTRR
jgi:hypothetical protein